VKEAVTVTDQSINVARTTRAPTGHEGIGAWGVEVTELTAPDRIVFCDGSRAEWDCCGGAVR
jgi:phosphoenolpyruvate carboxykinase (GTP)